MRIHLIISILQGFKRYLDYMNRRGFDEVIDSIKENNNSLIITMRGHQGETYELKVYLSETTNELHIENTHTNESIFDIIDLKEYGMTNDTVHYFKYGK